jgi:primase-polymerase (primpol)-like protein
LPYADVHRGSPEHEAMWASVCPQVKSPIIMSDMTYRRKPNLSTSAPDPTETGGRVQPASVSGPRSRQVTPESTPEAITTRRPWVGWNAEYRPEQSPQKPRREVAQKPETRRHAGPTARRTWRACDPAWAHDVSCAADGNEVVPDADDPSVGGDVDHRRAPQRGVIQPWAQAGVTRVQRSPEISPPGTGPRVLPKGQRLAKGRGRGDLAGYDERRFMTWTGHPLTGAPTTLERTTPWTHPVDACVCEAWEVNEGEVTHV